MSWQGDYNICQVQTEIEHFHWIYICKCDRRAIALTANNSCCWRSSNGFWDILWAYTVFFILEIEHFTMEPIRKNKLSLRYCSRYKEPVPYSSSRRVAPVSLLVLFLWSILLPKKKGGMLSGLEVCAGVLYVRVAPCFCSGQDAKKKIQSVNSTVKNLRIRKVL